MEYLRICLADEAPELGAGHRRVLAVALDDASALLLEPSTGATVRLPRADTVGAAGRRLAGYDSLARAAAAISIGEPGQPERLVARVVANCAANRSWSAVARDACVALGARPGDLPPVEGESAAVAAVVGGTGVDEPTTPHPGEKIGDFARRLWMTGRHDPDAMVALVKAAFPASKFDRGHVSWYRADLVRRGVADVPAVPRRR